MGRVRRARRIAAAAAFGGGVGAAGAGTLGLVGISLLKVEAAMARRVIGQVIDVAPDDQGRYGAGLGEPITLLMVGDSTAKGVGTQEPSQTVGAIVASGVAALSGRPVELTNVAVSGAKSPDLDEQVRDGLDRVPHPDVVLIMVGANDVTARLDRTEGVRHLADAVTRFAATGAEVVVGTCPDLGVIEPLAQPLRALVRRWSQDLAAAQTVAVVEAGGRTVSLGDLVAPAFLESPGELFSADRFHPSPAGYARTAAALLPSVCDAVGLRPVEAVPGREEPRREAVGPLPEAAVQAVRDPGTEVSATDVEGRARGRRGRWARVLRRDGDNAPPGQDLVHDGAEPAQEPVAHQISDVSAVQDRARPTP